MNEETKCEAPEDNKKPIETEDADKFSSTSRLPRPFTCYISACPEPRNSEFKEPEFLVCYKCPSALGPEGQTKYFCYPIIASSQMEGTEEAVEPYIPKKVSTSSMSESEESEEFTQHNNIPNGEPYMMNHISHNYHPSACYPFPPYVQQQHMFYQYMPTHGYPNFNGNVYF